MYIVFSSIFDINVHMSSVCFRRYLSLSNMNELQMKTNQNIMKTSVNNKKIHE